MLTIDKFEEASEVVKRVTQDTKLIFSDYFKLRGAYYKISTLTEEERAKGLITASAGNHAQGVAYAAKAYGAKAVIVMPTTTPLIKVERTKSYGAEVVLYGDVYDDACAHAYELAEEHGYTIADGTAVKTPGEHVFPYLQKNLDDVITVEDVELIVSFLDMVENHKMIVENSGLLTVAALKHLNVKGKKVVSVLSGGNMDVITMASVVQLGLIQRDRIFTISVLLPDRPGELTKVSQKIAEQQGNIIKLDHNQFYSTNRNAAVELKITMEAFGTEHKQQIMQELEKDGYRPKLIRTNL